MKDIKVVQTLPISVLNYWKYFMEDAEFKLRYHTRRGDQGLHQSHPYFSKANKMPPDIRIGSWTDAPNDLRQRVNTFQSPISSAGLVQTIVGSMDFLS